MGSAGNGLLDFETAESEEDYIRRMEAQSDRVFWTTYDNTYEMGDKAFRKTSRLPFNIERKDGTIVQWRRSWNHERIANEAEALEIVLQKTDIPVPRLLSHGSLPDGRQYLITEYIDGVILSALAHRGCSLLEEEKKHTKSTPCQTCSDIAYSNATDFISRTVLPQLAKLTSRYRGINGFVMPPRWLCPDLQPPWKGKQSWSTLPLEQSDYVFQHGDLAAHNIILDSITLEVRALLDWEYAGFFPAGMENWTGMLSRDVFSPRDENIAQLIKQFLAAEYSDAYNKWGDKAQLLKLIEEGKLPRPDQSRPGNSDE
ncbi:hypothetical protein DE146DRAFT_793189 [Phaeosphaeria sp. MPI-PUGE-AT-0046c]|nr:hypothetical protein DE146DRAFT_793189 [Phaeosphaeria sp. MPI-PUGE-AT-0046c]